MVFISTINWQILRVLELHIFTFSQKKDQTTYKQAVIRTPVLSPFSLLFLLRFPLYVSWAPFSGLLPQHLLTRCPQWVGSLYAPPDHSWEPWLACAAVPYLLVGSNNRYRQMYKIKTNQYVISVCMSVSLRGHCRTQKHRCHNVVQFCTKYVILLSMWWNSVGHSHGLIIEGRKQVQVITLMMTLFHLGIPVRHGGIKPACIIPEPGHTYMECMLLVMLLVLSLFEKHKMLLWERSITSWATL